MKILHISDTHELHREIKIPQDNIDILIHSGDATFNGEREILEDLDKWFGELKHIKYKIFTPGNHDSSLTAPYVANSIFKNCYCLIDEPIQIDGIKIYCSPYTPRYGTWSFMLERGPEMFEHWGHIPSNLDVLVTHGPPYGYCDKTFMGTPAGDTDLLYWLEKKRPKYHLCGHIHASNSIETIEWDTKRQGLHDFTIVSNAAMCDDSCDSIKREPTILEI